MDSSSFHEAHKEDGKVIRPTDKTDDEILKTEETGDKTEQQTETITNMGCELYWAAAKGEINNAMLERKDRLQSLLTPNKNTILHVYITSITTKHLDPKFVKEILATCPALLMQPNAKNETPLHIAARYGHASIVETLIQYAKDNHERGEEAARKMMRMHNQSQDTAFHEAVRFNHLSVVEILVKNEDYDFVYSANKEHETPLYMAAERGYSDIVFEILDKCKSPATTGPIGRNVLHAATIRKDKEMITTILHKGGDLMLKEADEIGWTPLHHAANMGYHPAVELFLKSPIGREAAYMKDAQGNTALHLAAALNHEDTIVEIMKWCPECCELVNNEGWNILHSAVQNHDPFHVAMDIILEKNAFSNLLNEKDEQGNTPLHHIAISLDSNWLDLIYHPRVDKMAFNKQNQNALDLASASKTTAKEKYLSLQNRFKGRLKENGLRLAIRQRTPLNDEEGGGEVEGVEGVEERGEGGQEGGEGEKRGEEEEENKTEVSNINSLDKAAETNLIVATLIATVTFTAAFTVPGGFSSEKGILQGTPILGNNLAFKLFIITDTIAMVLSSSAVFIHLFLRISKDRSQLFWYFITAFLLTIFAMAAMIFAFVTGTDAILGYSKALAGVTSVVGLTFFICFGRLIKTMIKKPS